MSRAKGISYMQRTLRELRKQGRICAVVERRIARPGHFAYSEDLFGIIDIIALDPERGVVGVQVCGQDFQPHVVKMLETHAQNSIDWLETPGTALELWGWRKLKVRKIDGKRGKAQRWTPRIKVITMSDFGE